MISIVNERLANPEDGVAARLDVVEKAGSRPSPWSVRTDGPCAKDHDIERQDFVVTTSNKPLNFRVKANVLFFAKKPAAEQPCSQTIWVYEFRTNVHFPLKQNPLRRADLDDFVRSYLSGKDRAERVESERWRSVSYDELVERDKANLDITWLRNESLEDADKPAGTGGHRSRDRRGPDRRTRRVRGRGCRARRLFCRLLIFWLFATLPTVASSTTVGSSRSQKSLTGIPHLPALPPSFTAERMPLPTSWGEVLGDTAVAAALLDRLLHRSVVLNLDGDSYRQRAHHARGEALRATTTGTRQPRR